MLAVFLVVSITGINIIDRIAKIFKNERPVANDKIHTLLISKEYLHIFNFLYSDFSIFNCTLMSLNNRLILSYIFNLYKLIFERNLS